jgi:colanic acid biosynthesis glycosyl transferase WcaI
MPRLTIVSQWYPPEQAPFGRMMHELAAALVACGWNVTVVTGFPNHPRGVVFEGFRKRWLTVEHVDGVRVCRVWLATGRRRGFLARIATFASFTLTAAWRLLREPGPDVIFAVLQPLSMGVTLPWIARLKGARLVFNLQDLHPDAQIRLGMVRNPVLIRLLKWMEAHAYASCAAITVICEQFSQHVIQRGIASDKVFVIENWVNTERIQPVPAAGHAFRREVGLDERQFVVLWAGTLGHVSGAEVIVEAARLLQDEPAVRFLIVGEGPVLPKLQQRAAQLGLTNVVFRPFQPEQKLAAVQSSADVSLVTLAPEVAEVSVPSKVLAYLAAGRPIIAAVPARSETAALVERAGAGVVVAPADPVALADAIRALRPREEELRQFGAAARAHVVGSLSAAVVLGRYDATLRKVVGGV